MGLAGETLDGLETVQAFNQEDAGHREGCRAAVETAFRQSVARIGARAAMTALGRSYSSWAAWG